MKRKRFSVEQTAYAITQAESGTAAAAICWYGNLGMATPLRTDSGLNNGCKRAFIGAVPATPEAGLRRARYPIREQSRQMTRSRFESHPE